MPSITCPATITVPTDAGQTYATITDLGTPSVDDNCGILAGSLANDVPANNQYEFGTHKVTWTVTDIHGNTNTCEQTIDVNRITTSTAIRTIPINQYSDRVQFSAMVTPFIVTDAGQAATSVTFKVGNQVMGTENLTQSGSRGLATGTYYLVEYDPDPSNPVFNGQMAPGGHEITTIFNGVDPDFEVNNAVGSITITKEDARVEYTGDLMMATQSMNTTVAIVTLRANMMDITAVDPTNDPYAGDIRNAKVMFVDRDAGDAPLSGWIPVSTLLDAADPTTGMVSYPLTVNLGSVPYKFITLGIIVDNGYYTRNSEQDNAVVTVYLPEGDFISGGGYIVADQSCGSYAADKGSKIHFGFHVKYNKVNTNLLGNLNFIFNRTESDCIVHTYQIKANAMQTLGVNTSNPQTQTAEYVSKCSLTDITDPLNPDSKGGNLKLYVKLTDNGDPGTNDMISFVLVKGNDNPTVPANIWISSDCVSNSTEQINLSSGNLVVHSGFDQGVSAMLTSDRNPSNVNDDITFTVTVYGGIEGKTVNFFQDGNPTEAFSTLLNSSGVVNWTTSFAEAGSYQIKAMYDGSVPTNILTQDVRSYVNVGLASYPNPSVEGEEITVTAWVEGGEAGKPVVFYDGETSLGTANLSSNLEATLTTSELTVGTHYITAIYNENQTSNIVTQVVNKAIILASSGNPSLAGDEVTFIATVAKWVNGNTVSFRDNDIEFGSSTVMGGTASFTTSDLSTATHYITAVYNGTITSDILVQAVRDEVVVGLTSSKSTSSLTEPVTFIASVPGGVNGNTVTFKDGLNVLGSSLLSSGKATFMTSSLSAGIHSITAVYDETGLNVTSGIVIQTVNDDLSIDLTLSKNSAKTKESVTLTATMSSSSGFIPIGTVTFKNGTSTVGSATLAGGTAILTRSFNAAGTYTITAIYNITGLASASEVLTVSRTKSIEIATAANPVNEYADLKVYPNPFSDKLHFKFISPVDAQVRIDLYDVTGQLVKTVFDNWVEKGVLYNTEFIPKTMVSEMYFYRTIIGKSVFNGNVLYKK